MKQFSTQQKALKFGFAFTLVVLGLILNYFHLGGKFLGFGSVGNWLIYVGVLSALVVFSLQLLNTKKRIVDERAQFIGMKAARVTYVFIILILFFVMILDGISPIIVPYSTFCSSLICGITLIYFLSYRVLERYN